MQVGVTAQPSEFQLELCAIQKDQFLLSKKMKNLKGFDICFPKKEF